jgi:L-2-hydroxyglutarate oxidase LhgO
MAESVECAVIGAGVVGLAIARTLAVAGHEVVVLEATDAIGSGTSSRNSEVIHAGMYYPKGSLKARFCVPGNRKLRQYMDRRKVDYRMVGKLIVATDESEEAQLETILAKGAVNGVEGLGRISGAEARRLEPEVKCTSALFSVDTGILDTHGLMVSLLGEIEENGGALALKSPVVGGEVVGDGIRLDVGGAEPTGLICRRVVNSAGLGAQKVAAAIAGLPAAAVPPLYLCKGNYFLIGGKQPFSRLVYPVPEHAGLGVHYTLDLAGQGRLGPDVEWTDHEFYEVDPRRGDSFYEAARRYWPGLKDEALRPGYSGIRPKLAPAGAPSADFLIQGRADHGVACLVNLFGMESPALTACLSIAEHVVERLEE